MRYTYENFQKAIARLLDHTDRCSHNQIMHPHNDVEMIARYVRDLLDAPETTQQASKSEMMKSGDKMIFHYDDYQPYLVRYVGPSVDKKLHIVEVEPGMPSPYPDRGCFFVATCALTPYVEPDPVTFKEIVDAMSHMPNECYDIFEVRKAGCGDGDCDLCTLAFIAAYIDALGDQ